MNNNNYKLKYTIMKRTLSIISLFSILLTACVGDPGPPGFDGQDGKVADVISVSNVNFNSPNFDVIVNFDQIYSDEVLLVYRLWDNNTWRLLPQTIIFDDGSLKSKSNIQELLNTVNITKFILEIRALSKLIKTQIIAPQFP